MTLTVFEDARGLWIMDGVDDDIVTFQSSSVNILVADGAGNVLDGTLSVNGTHFPVTRGKCKILTEVLNKVGFSEVEFVTDSGIKRPCSPIRATVSGNWFFPTPREALTNEEILVILRKMDQLRDKLASARSLCSETVSGVLGI